MAAYAQFGYGSTYPSANQLLGGGMAQSVMAPLTSSAPSPLSGSNENSLSPSGGSVASISNGPLSPGAISQTSTNNAGSMPSNPSASLITPATTVSDGTSATTAVAAAAAATAADVMNPTNAGSSPSCCENGRPIMTDPVSGQTVCSCQYDSARLALSSYSRMPATSVGVYGPPYPSTEQNPYPSISVDSSAFYTPLSNPYSLKENSSGSDMTAWTSAGLQPTPSYYSYDPTFAYGYGPSYDLAARRKNATRESTATLKAWLNEHKKNPYPTKGEKIMLAIITKMTLTQVSTWFANARRRLKKENKMTWEPKNKTDDDDDAMLSDDDKDCSSADMDKVGGTMYSQMHKDNDLMKNDQQKNHQKDNNHDLNDDNSKPENLSATAAAYNMTHGNIYNPYQSTQHLQHSYAYQTDLQSYSMVYNTATATREDCGIPLPASKPKIWSLADTVACKTPPPHGMYGISSAVHHQQSTTTQAQSNGQTRSFYTNNGQMNHTGIPNNSAALTLMSNYVNNTTYASRLPNNSNGADGNYAVAGSQPHGYHGNMNSMANIMQTQQQHLQHQQQQQYQCNTINQSQQQQQQQQQQHTVQAMGPNTFQQQVATPTLEAADDCLFELEGIENATANPDDTFLNSTISANILQNLSSPLRSNSRSNVAQQQHQSNAMQMTTYGFQRSLSINQRQQQRENRMSDLYESDSAEEAEDALELDVSSPMVVQTPPVRRLSSSNNGAQMMNFAKSLPIEIAHSPMASDRNSIATGADKDGKELDNNVDIAASIKALAKSVHGEAVFGELPRPLLRSQI